MEKEGQFIINREIIDQGDNNLIKIGIGKLPSGNFISLKAQVFRGPVQGPKILLLAGVHGDEINGVEIIRRTIASGMLDNLNKGTVITIPILNLYGFINFSREVPDGKDVNRSFPGNMGGSLASRVARTLTKKVLPNVDMVIDLHTGGGSRYNFPQVRYTRNDAKALEMAEVFGAPFMVQKPLISKSLRKVAREMGIPVLVFEGGESLRFDGYAIDKGLLGISRILAHHKMIELKDIQNDSVKISKTGWVRASQPGLFLWTKCSGHYVRKGEPLGVINDPEGMKSIKVLAIREGYIIGHNNACVVNQGDALFHIGYV
jgi:predicted deacylase